MQNSQTDKLNNLKDLQNSSMFYRGVIEDNNDTEMLGRVKVRIFGIHPDDESVTKEMLPWAELMQSTMFGFSSGVGISSIPVNGTYVWLFLENDDWNKPVIIGSIAGKSVVKDNGAFTDPDGVYPLDDRLEESDINRLARNEKFSDTLLGKKKAQETKGISTSTGVVWDQPETLNESTSYPDCTVIETKSGHIIEVDDTEGNERIHIHHNSGSFVELLPDGTFVMKSIKDRYEITDGDSMEVVQKNRYLTVHENAETKVVKNEDIAVGGDRTTIIDGKSTSTITGNLNVESAAKITQKSGAAMTIESAASMDVKASGAITVKGSVINLN